MQVNDHAETSFGKILAVFYARDLRQFIAELNAFRNEINLWKTAGSINNPAGNLALHIIGGTNELIGNQLAGLGYVRDRPVEFQQKYVERKSMVAGLEALIILIHETVGAFSNEKMLSDYPLIFDGKKVTNYYLLTQLLAHLNYHLGQVNYLRRMLE